MAIANVSRWALMPGLAAACLAMAAWAVAAAGQQASYVGSAACRSCHETVYESYLSNAKKAHSYQSIERMRKKLTPAEFKECFKCHTTGYGQPGGFRSAEETPHLKEVGCETCHGPGSVHAQSGDPADLTRQVTVDVCKTCHNPERVAAFRFKPLLYGGAH
jgi:hypothetical protein